MTKQINLNEQLLNTYLNVMILSKQFSSNKTLFLLSTDANKQTNDTKSNLRTPKSATNLKHFEESGSFYERSFSLEYDADSELTINGI